ncbi:MAG: YkvI family membrane protein [Peptostreptococcaceae bacterium]
MLRKSDVKETSKFAGTYISVCIGSGFATGQEIMQFFSAHGIGKSIFSALICMIVLSYCGGKLLEIGKTSKLKSANDIFTHLLGKPIGNVFKVFMPLFFLCSFVVMVAGAGASINQYYGLDKSIGSFIMIILCLLSVLLGITRVIDILGNIGPVIIAVSLGIGIITIFRNYESLLYANSAVDTLNVTRAVDNWHLTGIVYSGLNIIIVTPFLVGVGGTASNKKNCMWGGILGGTAFMIACLVLNLGILSDIENICINEIPTLYMADRVGPIVGILFSFILIGGIYTTAVPLLWSVCNSFSKEGTLTFKFIAIACSIFALIGGKIPFSALINLIYPISGALGVIIIVGIFAKSLGFSK